MATVGGASGSNTITPTIFDADVTTIDGGVETQILLVGSAFTNVTAQGDLIESVVTLAGADGDPIVLIPDTIQSSSLEVTIPGDLAAGAYDLRVAKADVQSDALKIIITPQVSIASAVYNKATGELTITGSGFTEAVVSANSGTSVDAAVNVGGGKNVTAVSVDAIVVDWTATNIVLSASMPRMIIP